MTPVGHSLFGASLAVAAMPRGASRRRRLAMLVSFAALANIPDLRLPMWGHERYDISHSIFVNAGLIALLAVTLVFLPRARRAVGGTAVIICGAAAWLSHLLLDSFYNHGKGVAILWPFSKGRLALPISWFDNLHLPLPHFGWHTARVMGIELLAYGTLFVLVCLARRLIDRFA
jgi:membrane-bound metal-dependent hydrolase YbcI (DUF457 family)